eukprot:TRINITY_DN6425_c0_g1_i1.p1 TRINITY_DN6425_c0_g1~~TRINITY_DN6425_c0_g1_i1.p1  ORF type:complete len:675 (+),score=130.96 TRINITY_DN6425_c0_g1_i1:30-2027(+)
MSDFPVLGGSPRFNEPPMLQKPKPVLADESVNSNELSNGHGMALSDDDCFNGKDDTAGSAADGTCEESSKDRQSWSGLRVAVDYFVRSGCCDMLTGFIVVCNIICMVVEADAGSLCEGPEGSCTPYYIHTANMAFIAIYTCELLVRAFAERSRFGYNQWNLLDVLIVSLAYVDLVLLVLQIESSAMFAFVRIFRLGRLLRFVKLLKPFPTLSKLATGLLATLRTVAWSFLLISGLLVVFALLAVELVQPASRHMAWAEKDWCALAFTSVLRSVIFFLQIHVAQDAWGDCTIPLMLNSPWTMALFAAALMLIQVGFVNLVLAVIIDSAHQAREQDALAQMEAKRKQEEVNLKGCLELMQCMDESRGLSLDKLLLGFDDDAEIQKTLMALDIGRNDLTAIFELMDSSRTGFLSCDEFINQLQKAQTQDIRVQMLTLKLHVKNVSRMLEHDLRSVGTSIKALELRSEEVLSTVQTIHTSICSATSGLTAAHAVQAQKQPVNRADSETLEDSSKVMFASGAAIETDAAGILSSLQRQLRDLGQDMEFRLEALSREATDHASVLAKGTSLLSTTVQMAAHFLDREPKWSSRTRGYCTPGRGGTDRPSSREVAPPRSSGPGGELPDTPLPPCSPDPPTELVRGSALFRGIGGQGKPVAANGTAMPEGAVKV